MSAFCFAFCGKTWYTVRMIYEYILFFFIYSFIGWCVEVVHAALKTGKFVNRGFLNGCVCPVYGVGVSLILVCLTPINKNIAILFFASVGLTTALEFVTGFVLEKLFHTKWWDYSREHFNVKGYVCLKYSLLWGLACVFVVDLVHPPIARLIGKEPKIAVYVTIGIPGALFLTDLVFTVIQLCTHERNYKTIEQICESLKVPSNAIGSKISSATLGWEERVRALRAKIRHSRLYKAFPEQKRTGKNAECALMQEETTNADDGQESAAMLRENDPIRKEGEE